LARKGSKDPAIARAALELLFAITGYAAEVAPQSIRAFAFVPEMGTLLPGWYSDIASWQVKPGSFHTEVECRKLMRLIRHPIRDDKWLSCQPSGQAILSN
jgi:hypothetical protein